MKRRWQKKELKKYQISAVSLITKIRKQKQIKAYTFKEAHAIFESMYPDHKIRKTLLKNSLEHIVEALRKL